MIQARQSFAPGLSYQDFYGTGSIFDALRGHEEQLAGVGASVADVAIEQKLEIEEERRREEDGPGYDEIVSEARRQREAMKAQYADGVYTMYGFSITQEELDTQVEYRLDNCDEFADAHGLEGAEREAFRRELEGIRDADSPEEVTEHLDWMGEIDREATEAVLSERADMATAPASRRVDDADRFEAQARSAPEVAADDATYRKRLSKRFGKRSKEGLSQILGTGERNQGLKIVIIGRFQGRDIGFARFVRVDKIGASPRERALAQLLRQHIADKAGKAAITIRKRMNGHQPMRKANSYFIGRIGLMRDPITCIVDSLRDIHADTIGVHADVAGCRAIFARPFPDLTEHLFMQPAQKFLIQQFTTL